MPTWKLVVEYDGTRFCGWQRQTNGLSIQQVLEEALKRLHSGDDIQATASGRTDAGVHARGQVVSFKTPRVLKLNAYERGLNMFLPMTVAVRHVEEAPEGFDARRWARGKRYIYRVLESRFRSPLRDSHAWLVHLPLDVEAMRAAAAALVGTHDFSTFRAGDCEAKTVVRELRSVVIERVRDEVVFTFEATAFLKHMVRNLVGTLVDTGLGKRTPGSMTALLAARDRTKAGPTAPATGLCLDEVFYDLTAGSPLATAD